MDFIRFILILLVPGLIASLAYNITSRLKTEINVLPALIFDLLIFIINITGLYFFKGIHTITELLLAFNCLSFTRRYALLSILIGILLGVIFGFIRKCFFWIRR